jgi:hypothetical protein
MHRCGRDDETRRQAREIDFAWSSWKHAEQRLCIDAAQPSPGTVVIREITFWHWSQTS